MYLVHVSYSKSPEEVVPHRPGHAEWLKKYLDAGVILFAGPKKSRLGGVIITRSIEKKRLQQIIAEDPFFQAEVADYHIVDFDCTNRASELEWLKDV